MAELNHKNCKISTFKINAKSELITDFVVSFKYVTS